MPLRVRKSATETPTFPVHENYRDGKESRYQSGIAGFRKVVSLLAAPMPDSVFMKEYAKPRNLGFHTVAGSEQATEKNSIDAASVKQSLLQVGRKFSYAYWSLYVPGIF